MYGCTIKNEYGTDSTDFLLSVDSKLYHMKGTLESKLPKYLLKALLNVCFSYLSVLSELLMRDDSEGRPLSQ